MNTARRMRRESLLLGLFVLFSITFLCWCSLGLRDRSLDLHLHNAAILSGPPFSAPYDDSISLSLLLKNAAIQTKERDSWFNSALDYENDGIKKLPASTFYGGVMIQPSSFCPADLIKTTSVSVQFDGGKWMCGASRLVGKAKAGIDCVVYSLGSQFDVSFERKIQNMTGFGCKIHVYDPTMKPPERVKEFSENIAKENIFLHEVAVKGTEGHSDISINGEIYKAMGLKTILETNGHICIDVLKFDVEGAEYDILEETDWERLCIGMVLFEMHGGIMKRIRGGAEYTVVDSIRHIKRLEKAGFHHYKTEQVWVGGIAQAEMAFVNFTWLAVNPGLPKVQVKNIRKGASLANF